MITPHKRKQLYKSLEKMNPTPESVKILKERYGIYTYRYMTTASMAFSMGFVFLGFYFVSITTSILDTAYGNEWIFGLAGVVTLLLSLPFLWLARSNDNAKRRVQ